MSMVDAVHASSAAPTYFEPVRVGARTLIDGGVFAVNPAALAYAEVTGEIDVLASVGTGQHRPLPFAEVEDWGRLECARPILDVVFDGGHIESRGRSVRIPSVVAHRPVPGQQSAPGYASLGVAPISDAVTASVSATIASPANISASRARSPAAASPAPQASRTTIGI
jgi:predicted acylesterase/phospholipase RssA